MKNALKRKLKVALILSIITPILIVLTSTTKTPIGLLIISFYLSVFFMLVYATPASLLAEYLSKKFTHRKFISFIIHIGFGIAFFHTIVITNNKIFNPGYLIALIFWALDEYYLKKMAEL